MKKALILGLVFSFFILELPAQTLPNLDAFQYRSVGPTRGGRATTVTGITAQPGTFYMGATGGGIWKTTDYGVTWNNVSDGFIKSPSIGAIRAAPFYPDIVYAGTGSDGLRSNIIAGDGMYKSADAGKTWQHIGLEKTAHIGAVEIHPYNADIVLVAAIGNAFAPNRERGIFRTKDGGKSWQQVLFISDTVGVSDLEFHPAKPDILYAGAWRAERKPWTIISGGANGGFYKSSNGGDTWQKTGKGLPDSIIGKIDLAVSPADPKLVYALVEAPGKSGGLYKSIDEGETFTQVSDKEELMDRPFYYCNVDADPKNPNIVYVLSTSYWKSMDGGKSWRAISSPHGDNHDQWINPENTDIMIQCNDGGANVTLNGGISWSTQNNQATAELYQVEVDDQYPYWLYAGQQDNSTIAVPALPPYDPAGDYSDFWMAVGGCETGPVVPKPGDPDIVYANCKGRFGVYNKRTGQEMQYYVGAANIYGHDPEDLTYRFQRVTPIHVSPHNPEVVYHGSQYVHRTADGGKTWERISPDLTANDPLKQVISGFPITRDVTGEEYFSTIYEIAESPLQPGVIWVGANDGPVSVTRNGGRTWTRVTPPGLGPDGRVDGVEPSPHDSAKAYVAILRYQLGDWKPYLFKTENFGKSWTLLTDGKNGIPANEPVRMVREDPERKGLLFAGTEQGLYISFDDGKKWHAFQQNLPHTPVTDIKIFRNDLILSTMGRGFWILDNIAGLRQDFTAATAHKEKVTLFQPAPAYRYRHRGTSPKSVPAYQAPGVLLDYYLPTAAPGKVRLDILAPSGELVRSFTSEKDTAKTTPAPVWDMATNFTTVTYAPQLKDSAGLHRFHWDMRHLGAWDKRPARSYGNGPLVMPGIYTARLTAGNQTSEVRFEVKMDPKVTAAGVTTQQIAAQTQFTIKTANLLTQTRIALDTIQSERKAIEERRKNEKASKDDPAREMQLKKWEEQLNTAEGRYMQPMLVEQVSYLLSMLNQADQQPGNDAMERFEELNMIWQEIRKQMSAADPSKP